MSEEIIKVLDDLGERFGIAIDWTNQNVMPYVQDLLIRYINYNITTNSILVFIGIVGLIIWIMLFLKRIKSKKRRNKLGMVL